MEKSSRNKTIDFPVEEDDIYLKRCISLNEKSDFTRIVDKVILGDTFKTLKFIPEECVNLIIADPPYNIEKSFHGNKFHALDFEKYIEYTENWILPLKKILKSNGSIYVCCDWVSSSAIETVLNRHFTVKNRITWQREKGRGAKANWKNAMEDIWFAVNSNDYVFNLEKVKTRRKVIAPYKENGLPKDWIETKAGNFRDTCPSNFWDDISIPYWSMPENTAHPTQKPEKLLAKLILASSNEGDLVFDPFLGSGSTAVTAKKLGRHFCGIEMNPQYCAWTQRRLETAETEKSIQGYTDGVFWERNSKTYQKLFE